MVEVSTKEEALVLLRTSCYLREFLATPNPLVNRSGPTCPFVPGALKMNTIWMALAYPDTTNRDDEMIAAQMKTLVRGYTETFTTLEPSTGPKALFKTIVLMFPTIPLARTTALIDRVQLELKQECVDKGIMIGEFHLYNTACGLRNTAFFPLRTPYPTLAIRFMVPGDLAFLTPEKYPVSSRVQMIQSFLKNFDTDDGRKRIKQADLSLAQSELSKALAEQKQKNDDQRAVQRRDVDQRESR
jgi:hypothetical protein